MVTIAANARPTVCTAMHCDDNELEGFAKMDDEITHLKCDVELNLTGPDIEAVNKRAAQELRRLADRIENDEFEDGFHPFVAQIGVAVGEVYMDYSGSPAEDYNA